MGPIVQMVELMMQSGLPCFRGAYFFARARPVHSARQLIGVRVRVRAVESHL